MDERYRVAFLDWLACAVGGWDEPAARAAREAEPGDLVLALATAGHALDFDDTYAPGLAHCSAPAAPVALVLGAEAGATIDDVSAAYAAGFEATAALARASHPELYRRGWHPTAVCGVVGAAVAASEMLSLDQEASDRALRLALLQAAGLRGAFGSDGKALQVGMAASAGARSARLARAGATATADLPAGEGGFEAAYGATWGEPDPGKPAIEENWIKAYPCCLQTHASIEAAQLARSAGCSDGPIHVRVHPVSVQAARFLVPEDPLQAKFSIPYTVARTVLHGPPGVNDFRSLDEASIALASRIEMTTDRALGESEAELEAGPGTVFRVTSALGSPERPMDVEALRSKIRSLGGTGIEELVTGAARAADVLEAVMSSAS